MKKPINIIALLLLTISLSVAAPVFAQNNEKKNEDFAKIVKLSQTKKPEDQEKAFQMSKDFLAKYGKNADDDQVKRIRDFATKYRIADFNKKLDEMKIAEAFALGKEMLAQEPENTYVVMNLAYGGFEALNKKQDKTFNAEAIAYAKQALSLLEAGKKPTTFAPFKDEAEATAAMYYVIGNLTLDTEPNVAAQNFYKAVQFESSIKNISFPYYALAFNYEKVYEKLANEFKTKVANKAPEAELIQYQEKLGKVIDRMIDAYARAVKVAETDNNSGKDSWRQRFTEVYKFRFKSEDGLTEYLNTVMSKPLPDPAAP